MRRNCIRCSSELLPNPDKFHWSHCPTCDPIFHAACVEQYRVRYLRSLVQRAVNDRRGTPRIGAARPVK